MSINENKGSQDKIHSTTENPEINKENLSFDEKKQSYELDVKGDDEDYDHPMGYETVAAGAKDDDSTYDEANPYVGDEYASNEDIAEDNLEELGMHVDNGESVKLNTEDEILARTPEDDRDDLDEEGYPINDAPEK
ncbi:hypothetical protein EV200_101330 [Pedobacter psychrotolerans]|uniref:Uncharacterized protein n=1 Tax=Pedobacter psychrotolerans TaxID=1843235 RepID=A0A4R2HQ90_9SPHI|nr:hypothetical protein [Pedobacter psychrotolerans]TCO30891.1 hypothetical protein EV200_101330 [Pedobacter psychrotolerans]GGE43730.1 hypothetical protein GCM10011413_07190 [Pedobacter psychrotolerans]